MSCLFPCLCAPRKSAQVKRVLAEMVRAREAEVALQQLTERLHAAESQQAAA